MRIETVRKPEVNCGVIGKILVEVINNKIYLGTLENLYKDITENTRNPISVGREGSIVVNSSGIYTEIKLFCSDKIKAIETAIKEALLKKDDEEYKCEQIKTFRDLLRSNTNNINTLLELRRFINSKEYFQIGNYIFVSSILIEYKPELYKLIRLCIDEMFSVKGVDFKSDSTRNFNLYRVYESELKSITKNQNTMNTSDLEKISKMNLELVEINTTIDLINGETDIDICPIIVKSVEGSKIDYFKIDFRNIGDVTKKQYSIYDELVCKIYNKAIKGSDKYSFVVDKLTEIKLSDDLNALRAEYDTAISTSTIRVGKVIIDGEYCEKILEALEEKIYYLEKKLSSDTQLSRLSFGFDETCADTEDVILYKVTTGDLFKTKPKSSWKIVNKSIPRYFTEYEKFEKLENQKNRKFNYYRAKKIGGKIYSYFAVDSSEIDKALGTLNISETNTYLLKILGLIKDNR